MHGGPGEALEPLCDLEAVSGGVSGGAVSSLGHETGPRLIMEPEASKAPNSYWPTWHTS